MLSVGSRDVLTEMVNIGAGRAAAALGEMVAAAVIREIPCVSGPHERSDVGADEPRSTVTLAFRGALRGSGTLELPVRSARRLVAALTGSSVDDPVDDELARIEVITEVGNIVVNSVLGSLGNLAELSLEYSPPEYREGGSAVVPGDSICASVAFCVELLEVRGRLAVTVEGASDALRDVLERAAPESA